MMMIRNFKYTLRYSADEVKVVTARVLRFS